MKIRIWAASLLFLASLTFITACDHSLVTKAMIDPPTATPTATPPPTISIWKNGAAGSWFGSYIWNFSEQCVISIIVNPTFYVPCISSLNIAATDNINGDTTCLNFYHPSGGNCTSGTMLEVGFNSWPAAQNGWFYYPVTLAGPMTQVTLAYSPGPTTFVYPVTVTAPPTTFDASAYYPTGHIQFDIRLEVPPSTFSSMVLNYGSSAGTGASYTVNYLALSNTAFTHLSIPLKAFTGNATGAVDEPFDLAFVIPGGTLPSNFVTLNDVKWTGN